jgi:hypothetical protein
MEGQRVGRIIVQVALVAALPVALVVGCAEATAPTDPPGPARAVDVAGALTLELTLSKDRYAVGEPIEGSASLVTTGAASVGIASGSPLIMFSLIDLAGVHTVVRGQDSMCESRTLNPGEPVVQPLSKSGGFDPEDPSQDWIEDFLTDPVYRLPAGDWEIRAQAGVLGSQCTLPAINLEAAVRISVE